MTDRSSQVIDTPRYQTNYNKTTASGEPFKRVKTANMPIAQRRAQYKLIYETPTEDGAVLLTDYWLPNNCGHYYFVCTL